MKEKNIKRSKNSSTKSALVEGGFMQRAGLALHSGVKSGSRCAGFCPSGHLYRFCFGLILGESPVKLSVQGGKAFWTLVRSPCRWSW